MLATEKGKKYFDAKKSKVDASLRFHEIFHCFMVLCLDFEDVNSFFMGISRRAYYYMHQFFQARFYCFESLQVCLGWEKRRVNDVAKTQKKLKHLLNLSWILHIAYLLKPYFMTSFSQQSQYQYNREKYYVRYLNIFLPLHFSLVHPALLLRPLRITIQSKLSNNELVNLALPNQRQSFH